jgi:AcrR family transcriptional regulator
VLDVARARAEEGGYEAVQMREIAAESGIALGTLYRYFSSKDHLLAEVMAEWTADLAKRVAQRPPRGTTPAERLADILARACRALERQPLLAAAVVRAIQSPEPNVVSAAAVVRHRFDDLALSQLGHMDADRADRVVSTIGAVWLGNLVLWCTGRLTMREVSSALEDAALLLAEASPSVCTNN